MKKTMTMTIFVVLMVLTISLSSCKTYTACECVEQFNYFRQDGGLFNLDQKKLVKCTEEYKDASANYYPEDLNSAERNARKECNK